METKERLASSLVAALILGLGFATNASGQTLGTYNITPTKADDLVVPGFYPSIELDLAYDDNIYRTESNTVDSMLFEARPELQWVGVMGKHVARVGYQGYYGWYDAASSANFDDHFIGADVTLDLTKKFNLNLTADYRREHEPFSFTVVPVGTEQNRWQQWAIGGEAVYGRRIATAQVAVKAVHRNRQYTNNGQEFRDRDEDELAFTFFYNVGPKTQLLVEPSLTKYRYHATGSTFDNDLKRLLVGVTWDATAKTTGVFKVGYHDKQFDNGIGDTSGLSTEAKIIWKPKTYSTVTGTLSRNAYDSALGGSSRAFEALIAKLDWTHELTRLTELQTGVRYEQDDYDVGREDDITEAYLGVSYALRRWLTVGVRYDYQQRDSNQAGADFDDNRIAIGLKAALR